MSFTLKPYVNTGQAFQPKFPYAPLHWGLKGNGGPVEPVEPVEPSGFAGKYLSYYLTDFSLVAGNSIGTWSDRSTNNNNLTQTTSANQPLLIEDTQNQFNNVVRADATNDVMVGLPAHNSLVFKKGVPNLNAPSAPQIYAVNSANLNGTNQYFIATNQSEINTPTTLTVAYWVKPTDFASFRMQCSKHGSLPSQGGFYTGIGTDAKVNFNVRGDFGNINTVSTTSLIAGDWSYVECKVTGTAHEIWINGALAGSSTSTEVPKNNTINLQIGNNVDGNSLYHLGGLSFFEMYNRSLSQSETGLNYNGGDAICFADKSTSITNDCVYAPRLANYNGNAGQELVDQSVSGIATTNVNSTPFTGTGLNVECTPSATQTYTANYADFDTDQTAYTSPFLDMGALKSSGFSVSFWGKASQYSSSRLFTIGNQTGDPSPSDFTLKMDNQTTSYFTFYNGSSYSTAFSGGLNFDVLRHITVTYGGTADQNFRLYVDGSLRSTISGSNYAVGSWDQYVTIGGTGGAQGGSEVSGGVKGHVFMFNKKLEQADIDNLYSDPTYVYNSLSEIGLDTSCILSVRCSNWNGNNGSEFTEDTGNATVSLNTGVAGSIAIDGTGPNVIDVDIERVLFSSSTTSAQVRISADNVYEVVSDGGTVYAFNAIKSGSAQEVNIINRVGDNLELFDAVGYKETLDVTGETFTIDRALGSASDADWKEIWSYPNALDETGRNYFYYLRNDQNEILLPPLLPDPNQNQEFIFSVKTDNAPGVSNNDQMKIGTIATGVYDCIVDWGDGSSDVITTWDDPAWTHTYSVAGTYVITISGTSFTYPYFYLGDDIKVLNVSKWGFTDYGTTALDSFRGCSNLTLSASDIPDTNSCTSLLDSWQKCSSLTSFPLINTSSVTLMSNTWYACSSLTSFPLINTSSVTAMQTTWAFCSSLTSFPLINTSSVNSMSSAWFGCSSLTDFPLIDVSSCTNFTDTWKGCALNSASIDNIMQALVNGNQNNLSTDISGGTNLGFSSWSAGAVANYNTLISRGWTITTNP